MATPAAAPRAGAPSTRPAGPMRCFKCGGRHLMRDCTAPQAEVDAYRAARRAEEAAGGAPDGAAAAAPAAASTLGAKSKRKRKITLEDLKSPLGLPDLYAHLVSRFRARRRGKGAGRGHEAADAAALVDIYAEWAARLAPGLPFPVVLDQLEALGKTAQLKSEMRELREGALGELDLEAVEAARRGDGWFGGGVPAADDTAAAAAPTGAAAEPGPVDEDDALVALALEDEDEGDELLELQAMG